VQEEFKQARIFSALKIGMKIFLEETGVDFRIPLGGHDHSVYEVYNTRVSIASVYAVQSMDYTFDIEYAFGDGQSIRVSRTLNSLLSTEDPELFNIFIFDPLTEEFSRRSQCSLNNFKSSPILLNSYAIARFLGRRPELLRMADPANYDYLLKNFPEVVKPQNLKKFKKIKKLVL